MCRFVLYESTSYILQSMQFMQIKRERVKTEKKLNIL